VRRFLGIAALASVALLVYASLVPLRYRPLSWESTWEAWRHIPWLSLDVFHRADWVANALVVLPAGILAAAAVDWGRHSSRALLLATPLITFALTLVVIGIELVQVWFPPRTVSLNDIAAGFVGAALGPMLWAIGGPFFERGMTRFLTLPRFRDRLKWLCIGWFVAIAVYGVLPLDLVMSHAEWQEKIAAGRIQWNPLQAAVWRANLVDLALASLSLAPIGIYCAVRLTPEISRWVLWLLPVALQLIQLPFFSKTFSTSAIAGGWMGGWSAYWLGSRLDDLAILARRPLLWATGWGLAIAFALAELLGGYGRVVRDPAEIKARFAGAWSWPLVKYYAKSEYGAYTNMFEKMAVFAAIGACCAGWSRAVGPARQRLVTWTSLVVVICVAVGIELVQVYLPPSVPDMADAIVYLAGYMIGYFLVMSLWKPADGTADVSLRGERYRQESASGKPEHTPTSSREARQRIVWILCGVALLAIAAYGSLVPLHYTPRSFNDAWPAFLRSGTRAADISSVDWGVNVMLLVPASFCFLAAAVRPNSTIAARIFWSLVVAISCLAFSVFIELAQSWFPPRVPTMVDVIAQLCGAVLGIVVWWICGPTLHRAIEAAHVDDTPQNRLGLVLLAYVVGVLFFSLAPLDLTLHPVDLVNKYRNERILFIPFSYPAASAWQVAYDVVADVAIFVPVGVFATTFLARRNNTDRSLAHSLALGCAIVAAIEAMQLLVLSRFTDVTDLLTGSVGVAIGVFGYRYFRGTSSVHVRDANLRNWWMALALGLYAVFLLAVFWYPFDYDVMDTAAARQRVSHFFGIPFSRAIEGNYLAAQDGILRKFLLFVPVGVIVALFFAHVRRDIRIIGLLAASVLTAGLAMALELGQAFLPGRFVSFDDVLICLTGAFVGYWATKRFAS